MKATKEQMKKIDRLKRRSDFLRVQNQGKKWVSKSLVLQIADGADSSAPLRFGLTVSRKTSKSAVIRNRIKRRLRAAAYDILPLHARPGVDYVLIGREDTATRAYDDVLRDLKWCLDKTGYRAEGKP